MINVAVVCTWRFEELNVLLEILKQNFKHVYNVNAFCNLADVDPFLDVIEFRLIDRFIWLRDDQCGKVITKSESRRRQPLDMFVNALKTMLSSKIDKWIITECDVFPLDEDSFSSHIHIMRDGEVKGRFIRMSNDKVPDGYMSPAPIYFSRDGAEKFVGILVKNRERYLADNRAFEGMLGHAASIMIADGSLTMISDHFISNYVEDSNLEPVTMTTHQHNPFRLVPDFLKRNITEGLFIKSLLNGTPLVRRWNNEVLSSIKGCDVIAQMPIVTGMR